MKRRLGTLLTLTLLVFVASSTMAGNGRVEIIRTTLTDQMEVVADCGGYLVLEDFDSKMTIKLHYDKDGSLIKEMISLRMIGHSTFYNSENPEIALRGGPEGIVFKFDYVNGTLTMSGLNYKVTLPGVGMIFHQGGHYTFDFETGMWTQVGGPDDWFSGNTDALCEALAP